MKKLVIFRGIPGCGKSYDAFRLASGDRSKIFSADDFFGQDYKFDVNLLYRAHQDCQRRASRAMQSGHPLVIIDNTNIRMREIIPYVVEGFWYDYEMEIREPSSLWWVKKVKPACISKDEMAICRAASALMERNVHNVPYKTIVKMIRRWTDITIPMVMDGIFGNIPDDQDAAIDLPTR